MYVSSAVLLLSCTHTASLGLKVYRTCFSPAHTRSRVQPALLQFCLLSPVLPLPSSLCAEGHVYSPQQLAPAAPLPMPRAVSGHFHLHRCLISFPFVFCRMHLLIALPGPAPHARGATPGGGYGARSRLQEAGPPQATSQCECGESVREESVGMAR